MMSAASCIYTGTVLHKRLTPKAHAFSYRVFALCLDVDAIDQLDTSLRFFSRNRWNLLSFSDRDHGAGDRIPVAEQVRDLLGRSGLEKATHRVMLLCYPRLLGFVFNPLSVYFCYGTDDRLGAVVYEVSNTFGERKSYVIPVADNQGDVVAQSCSKQMYVSPFTPAQCGYGFHVVPPNERVVVGVTLRDDRGPILKTHFRGDRRPLTDRGILALMLAYPLMTLKVVAAIHLEAARLWWKGVPLVDRHVSPRFSFTVVPSSSRDASHVTE